MAKINERFEFPMTLDMDRDERKYFTEEADPSVRNLYKLHSVLVHSGGPNGGHYYAFIRPLGVEQWYRFDDERVTKVTQKEASRGSSAASSTTRSRPHAAVEVPQDLVGLHAGLRARGRHPR